MRLKAIYEKLDEIPAEFQVLYTEKNGKFELTGVEGVKTQGDVDRVHGSLVKEREEHDATRRALRAFGDHKPEAIQALIDERDELKIRAGKVTDDAINELVEKRVVVRLRPVEKERDDAKAALQERDGKIAELTGRETRRSLSDTLRSVASGEKGVPVRDGALDDIELIAPLVFEVVDGKHVTREGNPLGVDAGLDPKAFLESVMTTGKRPGWFKDSQGAGAGGGGGGGAGNQNPFTTEHWNITAIAGLVQKNPALALRMAKASKDARAAVFVKQLSK